MRTIRTLGIATLALMGSLSAEDVVLVEGGVTAINGVDPTTTPASNQVLIGGGQIRLGQTGQAAPDQAVRGDDPRLNGNGTTFATLVDGKIPAAQLPDGIGSAAAAFYSMISNANAIEFNGASANGIISDNVTATPNRMHFVRGTLSTYDIALPSASGNPGAVVGFSVKDYAQSNKQYRLDAGGSVKIAGRTRYLALVHTNVALLMSDGNAWLPLVLQLDSPWAEVQNNPNALGTIPISSTTTTSPTPGNTSVNKAFWRRSGDSVSLKYSYEATTGGVSGSGGYLFALPQGLNADPDKQNWNTGPQANDAGRSTVGTLMGSNTSDELCFGSVRMYDHNRMHCYYFNKGGQSYFDSSCAMRLGASQIRFTIHAQIPITNW